MCSKFFGTALCLIGLSTFYGCGGTDDVAPATGVVTLDGNPLADARVMLHPIGGGPRTSYASTDEKGEFKASTYGMNDGALIGRHKVSVSKVDTSAQVKIDPKEGYSGKSYESMMAPKAMAKAANPKSLIPEKYGTQETSGIEVEVVKGKRNHFTLDLLSKTK